MPNANEWREVVKRLAEKTEEGSVEWTVSHFATRDNVVGSIYEATVKGRLLICYEFRYANYTDVDTWEWENSVAIEFVDALRNLEWKIPDSGFHRSLLDAIRYRASKAHTFLADFFKDD